MACALISAAQLRCALVMGLKEPPKTATRLRARDRSSDASAIVLLRVVLVSPPITLRVKFDLWIGAPWMLVLLFSSNGPALHSTTPKCDAAA